MTEQEVSLNSADAEPNSQVRWFNQLQFEAPCKRCKGLRCFQKHIGLFGGVKWRCNVCEGGYGEDPGTYTPAFDPEKEHKKTRAPEGAFAQMIAVNSDGSPGIVANLWPEEWAALKALYDPEKGRDSWRDLQPKDASGFPTMTEEEYLKRAHHILKSINKDKVDALSETRSRATEANLEAQYAATHCRLKCGCLVAKDLVFTSMASNLANYTRRGWPPFRGAYASCHNPNHDTLLDRDGNLLSGATDYRDYKIVEKLMKER